jgi:uncharacterized protein YfaS (alpha-2-macroglobulin family)
MIDQTGNTAMPQKNFIRKNLWTLVILLLMICAGLAFAVWLYLPDEEGTIIFSGSVELESEWYRRTNADDKVTIEFEGRKYKGKAVVGKFSGIYKNTPPENKKAIKKFLKKVISVNCGTDGKFSAALKTGKYHYEVKREGFLSASGDIEIKQGEKPEELTLFLKKLYPVTIEFNSSDMKSLEGLKFMVRSRGKSGYFIVENEKKSFDVEVTDNFSVNLLGAYFFMKVDRKSKKTEPVEENREISSSENFFEPVEHEKIIFTVEKGEFLSIKGRLKGSVLNKPAEDLVLNNFFITLKTEKKKTLYIDYQGKPAVVPKGNFECRITHSSPILNIINAPERLDVKDSLTMELDLELKGKPQLWANASDHITLPDRNIGVYISGKGMLRYKLTLFKLDEERITDAVRQKGNFELSKIFEDGSGEILETKEFEPKKLSDVLDFYRDFSFGKRARGLYSVQVKAGGFDGKEYSSRAFINVNSLGVEVKTDPEKTVVFAMDRNTGEPVKADVILNRNPVSKNEENDSRKSAVSVQQFQTNDSGLLEIKDRSPESLICLKNSLGFAVLSTGRAQPEIIETRTYFYTDRPVYRPSQTVYFKGIMRNIKTFPFLGNVKTAAGKKIQVRINDPVYNEIFKQTFTADDYGSFYGEFELPSEARLGSYEVVVSDKNKKEIGRDSFSVISYRKPAFTIDLKPMKSFITSSETSVITGHAMYYYGEPLKQAKVKYRIFGTPSCEDYFCGDAEWEGQDTIEEAETITDDSGNFQIQFRPEKKHSSPFKYTVEADVTDAAQRIQTQQVSWTVVPTTVYLTVETDSYAPRIGALTPIKIVAKKYEDKNPAANINVEVSVESPSNLKEIFNVTLGNDGTAMIKYTFKEKGYHIITVIYREKEAEEKVQKDIYAGSFGIRDEEEIKLIPDKTVYRIGETMKILISGNFRKSSFLLTVEGDMIYYYKVFMPVTDATIVEIPVEQKYFPGISLSLTSASRGYVYTTSARIGIEEDREKRMLNVDVMVDKKEHEPGDEVLLKIESQSEAQFSVAVVDESIFALTSRHDLPDIYGKFFTDRAQLVKSFRWPSYTIFAGGGEYEGSAEKFVVKVRKVFKDTAFWKPDLVVRDSSDVKFTLPDNITKWRITLVGQTKDHRFSIRKDFFITKKELIVNIGAPRFMVEEDQLVIPATVQNLTGKDADFTGEFAHDEHFFVEGNMSLMGKLAKGETQSGFFKVKAAKPGEGKLMFRAKAGDKTDAIEISVPVLRKAVTRRISENAVVKEDRASVSIAVPDDAVFVNSMSLTVSGSVFESMSDAMEELVEFPYGCVEQTMSRWLPAVALKGLKDKIRLKLGSELEGKLKKVVEKGLVRLCNFQHSDGGWGWWVEDDTNPYQTAYVISGLCRARKYGIEVNPDIIEKGCSALSGMIQKEKDAVPYMYNALAECGMNSEEAGEDLKKNFSRLRTSEKVLVVNAMANLKSPETKKYMNDIFPLMKHSSPAYLEDPGESMDYYSSSHWFGSPVEITGMFLSTVAKEMPSDQSVYSMMEFLMQSRSGNWWETTKATSYAVAALKDYLSVTKEMAGSYSALIRLNGNEIQSVKSRNGSIISGDRIKILNGSEINDRKLIIEFEKQGEGNLYGSVLMKYQAKLPPDANYMLVHDDLKMERSYYLGDKILNTGAEIKVNDIVGVRLKVDAKKDFSYVMIQDPIPAGFEFFETQKPENIYEEYEGEDEPEGGSGWFTHREEYDERIVFFVKDLPEGDWTYSYSIRPELEGNMIILPAQISPMYMPRIKAETGYRFFKVKK